MFAFALWDREENTLWLVRDRMGIKPLYYMIENDRCAFASELKAFAALPGWQRRLDTTAAYEMLRLGYVPGEQSILEGVRRLPPGHLMKVSLADGSPRADEPATYWSLDTFASKSPDLQDEHEAKEQISGLIEDAVGMRMVADVPLGAFLSGGIDSTLVTAAMQRQSPTPIKTFSIGFSDEAYDEAGDAKRIAKHLGTEHHELYVAERDMLDLVVAITEMYDEPFADSSQLPTALLARLTREHVTVALSGDGGDELCAGYTRHFQAARIDRLFRLPGPLRKITGRVLQSVSVASWDRTARWLRRSMRLPGDKLHKLGSVLTADNTQELYEAVAASGDMSRLWRGPRPSRALATGWPRTGMTSGERFVLQDMRRYLPDDILTKVDRATMAFGLEARVPLLDHRLIELAWRIPFRLKVKQGQGKWLLREILAGWVPETLWNRPKMGFSVPIGGWLKGPLKEWSEYHLLDAHFYRAHGLLDRDVVTQWWQQHLRGSANHQHRLWNILMFHAWYDRWLHQTT